MLSDHISYVALSGSDLFVKAAPVAMERGLHATVGEAMIALEPLGAEKMFRAAVEITPEELDEADIILNGLEDWAAEGTRTYQIQFKNRERSRTLPLGSPVALAEGLPSITIGTYIAGHRAAATLEVEILDATGQVLERAGVDLQPNMQGGRTLDLYQKIDLTLPLTDKAHKVALVLNYLSTNAPGSSHDPYVFLVEPVLSTDPGAQLSHQTMLHQGPDLVDAGWFRATVPSVRAGAAGLDLVVGDQRMTILAPPPQSNIRLLRDDGHSLCFQASEPVDARLFLNGRSICACRIEPDDSWLRLPAQALTGEPARLEIRDSAGLRTLYETWILPPRVLTPTEVLQRETSRPFPVQMFSQSAKRYEALRAHLEAGSPPEVLAQLAHAIDTLEAGYDNLKLRPLTLPEVEEPEVSIIIPAHNKVKVTYAGLCALLLAWNRTSFEVILVDDASSDETATIERLVSGLKVVRNVEPQRFIRACNAGVAASRGKYVVLLNNDTEPTTGWLDELRDTFDRFDKVGMVGSKLIYPDGTLQDAGGIIWGSGNPWNYGNRQNPWDPRFCYARQADYLSGAALMMPRDLWDRIGGLSQYLEPMYFEDTDLAFKVREAGFSTWFMPTSIVYHYEGMTSGTSTASGFKRFQEVNRPKFKRRWSRAFANHGREGELPDLEKDRGCIGRVLFIDYMLPRPDQDAGSYAAIQEIRLVQSLGFKVTFLPENIADLGHYTTELQRMGVEVITAPFVLSVNEFLEARGREFDAFYLTRYHVAENVTSTLRRINPQARIILNNADLHFLRVMRKMLTNKGMEQISDVDMLRNRELAAMRSVDLVLSYNEVEHAVIQSHTNGAVKVAKCPWVVQAPATVPERQGRKGLSFLGSFRHDPNEEGVLWFTSEVMARLANTRPETVLSIYGSGMNDRIRNLASPQIDPVGFIETLDLAYDRHMAFVAPLLSGAGIKGKVLGALAHGIPCVLSPVAAEGIGLRSGYDCLIANTPAEWESAILRLLDDAGLWNRISTHARELVEDVYSFTKGRKDMRHAFETVDIFGMLE
ncbi:glycosyltransferase [Gemmobacter lutimaris]|uniref:Glycosyltransferase n=1 Tax=Gemmobacter lutimaris TaxID=2306023 RepID=A0A398BQY5_9RHOB|nr:glycosyltransferase [Gemmobacter lutimaris]RID90310.1 glycosyltransferase [Gemmobacter lutimaris]